MSTVSEIERAIDQLAPDDFATLRRWFIEKDNARWDAEIDGDATSGRLDFLFEEASAERVGEELRDWPDNKA